MTKAHFDSIDVIKNYYSFRGMKEPTAKEALDFAVTEIGEAMDAYIREHQDGWIRNSPDKKTNFAHELADAYMMLEICSHKYNGKSLMENLLDKFKGKGFEYEINSL